MILLIDNYDSFAHNLGRYLERLGQVTQVVRNDVAEPAWIRTQAPSAIVLSPGPCTPDKAGQSLEVVRQLHLEFPILGICLGHQTIAQALGGCVIRAPAPVHGRTSQVHHDGRGVFQGIPDPITVCRYHSLVVEIDSLPSCLEVSASTSDGVNMAIRHKSVPVVGLQFHPESILTEHGYCVLGNFLRLAGLPSPAMPDFESELTRPKGRSTTLPDVPVTF
ncbi:MAG: aminodeoxychorismate/anthranilate synthase component II [Pirellulaceae bacterium]